MRCHVCVAPMQAMATDLPFKVSDRPVVVLKALPVLQCENCREVLISDSVMERVEVLLAQVSKDTELEVLRFAA